MDADLVHARSRKASTPPTESEVEEAPHCSHQERLALAPAGAGTRSDCPQNPPISNHRISGMTFHLAKFNRTPSAELEHTGDTTEEHLYEGEVEYHHCEQATPKHISTPRCAGTRDSKAKITLQYQGMPTTKAPSDRNINKCVKVFVPTTISPDIGLARHFIRHVSNIIKIPTKHLARLNRDGGVVVVLSCLSRTHASNPDVPQQCTKLGVEVTNTLTPQKKKTPESCLSGGAPGPVPVYMSWSSLSDTSASRTIRRCNIHERLAQNPHHVEQPYHADEIPARTSLLVRERLSQVGHHVVIRSDADEAVAATSTRLPGTRTKVIIARNSASHVEKKTQNAHRDCFRRVIEAQYHVVSSTVKASIESSRTHPSRRFHRVILQSLRRSPACRLTAENHTPTLVTTTTRPLT